MHLVPAVLKSRQQQMFSKGMRIVEISKIHIFIRDIRLQQIRGGVGAPVGGQVITQESIISGFTVMLGIG